MIFTKKMIKVLKHFIKVGIFEVIQIKYLKYEDKKTYFDIAYLNRKYLTEVKTVYINGDDEIMEAQEDVKI